MWFSADTACSSAAALLEFLSAAAQARVVAAGLVLVHQALGLPLKLPNEYSLEKLVGVMTARVE